MQHKMSLHKNAVESIKNQEKTFELRLNDAKRQGIKIGDEILFSQTDDPQQQILVEVVSIHWFYSFKELYETIDLRAIGYSPSQLKHARWQDMNQYYPIEQQQEQGVLAIEMKLKTFDLTNNPVMLLTLLGLAFGVAVGTYFNQLTLGIPLGMLLGLIIAMGVKS